MKKTIAFTVITLNYLAMARTLASSLSKVHPEIEFITLIADKKSKETKDEDFRIFYIDDLGIDNKEELLFKYNITELCTAIKPKMILYIIKKFNPEIIFYFDPDIYVYNRLDIALSKLEDNDIVITPHITTPYPEDSRHPNEIDIMQAGSYNLGFIGLKNNSITLNFVMWWWRKLQHYSINMIEKGLFTDQKWIDLCPCFVEKVHILRDICYNIAYWNIHERNNFSKKNNTFYIEDKPIVFFHFSGLVINHINSISKYQNRYSLSDFNYTLKEIFFTYKKELITNGYARTSKIPYSYSSFKNGVAINDVTRRIYYNIKNKKRLGDPFSVGDKSFYSIIYKKKQPNIYNKMLISGLEKARNSTVKNTLRSIFGEKIYSDIRTKYNKVISGLIRND